MGESSLKLQVMKNIGIITCISYVNKLATIITGIILARILDPTDFGIYGLSVSIMAFVLVFDELGLKPAVIQKKTEDEQTLFLTGFYMKLIISLTLFVLTVFMIAPWTANIYKTPDLEQVTILLAVSMLVSNFKFVPEAKVIKSGKFNKLIFPSVIDNLSYSVIVICLAVAGFRFWSFVYAKVASSILAAVAYYIFIPWRISFTFDKEISRHLVRFGSILLASALLSMGIKQIDNLIVGKLLGLTALGYYAFAYRWGSMLSLDIGKIINQVLYPINVKYQGDPVMLEKLQMQSLKYVALLVFPISVGFALVAPEFVVVVLGEKWAPAILPLQIFSFHGLLWALMKRGGVFIAMGKPQYPAILSCISIVLLIVFIPVLTKMFGISGAAMSILISFFLVGFCLVWWVLITKYDFSVRRILRQLTLPFISSMIMMIGIVFLKNVLYKFEVGKSVILLVAIIAGAVIYFIGIWMTMPSDRRNIANIMKLENLTFKEKFRHFVVSL